MSTHSVRTALCLEQIQHRLYASSTFIAFNFLFFLGVRPTLGWLPNPVQNGLSWLAVLVSSLWLHQVWKLGSEQHRHKRLANGFRRQLRQLPLESSQVLGNRSIDRSDVTAGFGAIGECFA
jgi:hypothetical protein